MLIEPARTLADEGGFGSESYHEKVSTAYRVAKKETELLFGVDRDLKTGKDGDAKRSRKRTDGCPISGMDALRQIDEKRYADRHQETWSLGYGEITSGSFENLLHYMIYDAPEQLRLREGMRFLDIGSGFGKVVVHARLAVPKLSSCVGIECLPIRVEKSNELADILIKRGIISSNPKEGVQFIEGDAARKKTFDATHIFCFNYVFSDTTHAGLIPALERSLPLLLVMFIPPYVLRTFGGNSYRLIYKFSGTTTGGQHPTGYVYARREYLGMVPALADDDDPYAEDYIYDQPPLKVVKEEKKYFDEASFSVSPNNSTDVSFNGIDETSTVGESKMGDDDKKKEGEAVKETEIKRVENVIKMEKEDDTKEVENNKEGVKNDVINQVPFEMLIKTSEVSKIEQKSDGGATVDVLIGVEKPNSKPANP